MVGKFFLLFGSISAGISVILGALGAHAFEKVLSENLLKSFKTGVTYQFYHSLALLVIAILMQYIGYAPLKWSARCLMIGTLAFSGSIYLLAFRQQLGIESLKSVLGPITPIGGLFFIAGWALLVVAIAKNT